MSQKNSLKFSTVLFSNGVFQGFIQNKLREGLGVYIWDSGEMYFGEWHQDNIEGEGYFFQQNGSFIHALFQNNKVHGPGILKLPDLSLVLGYWDNGFLSDLAYKYFPNEEQWFLCEFSEREFSQCLGKGKGFPENLPDSKIAGRFGELTDMNEIVEKANILIKDLNQENKYDFMYRTFDDGGIYMGLTKEKIPHGYGIFKFADDKLHIGLYSNGIMEGPCFVQFQNGDFYCGELKRGKFDGVSLFFQKNKETWYHSQYKAGNQQKILNKSAKSNNEMKEISRSNFKKTVESTFKTFTPNNLYSNPIFPPCSDLLNYYSKDWGLSPIKTSKKLIENKKLENERKINIYEIILNEGVSPANPIIKLNDIINQNTNDPNNERNSEAPNPLKSNQRKTTDSPQLQVDISHREMLDEPRELSFNKEGINNESQDYHLKQQRESVFAKQKASEGNNLNQAKAALKSPVKEMMPNEISDKKKNENEASERKNSEKARKDSKDRKIIIDQTKINSNEARKIISDQVKNDSNERKAGEQVKYDPYERKISDQAEKNSTDKTNFDKNSEHEELEQKINQNFKESLKKALPGTKNEEVVPNFASDIKKIMNNVQNVIAKVEEDRKYGNPNKIPSQTQLPYSNNNNNNNQKDDIPSNLNAERQYNNLSQNSPLALKVPVNSTQMNNSDAIISPNNMSTNSNNLIYPDILETKHLIIPPKMTNQILKKQEEKLAQKKLDSEKSIKFPKQSSRTKIENSYGLESNKTTEMSAFKTAPTQENEKIQEIKEMENLEKEKLSGVKNEETDKKFNENISTSKYESEIPEKTTEKKRVKVMTESNDFDHQNKDNLMTLTIEEEKNNEILKQKEREEQNLAEWKKFENSEKISFLSQIEEINKEIDLRLNKWKNKNSSKIYSGRLNCNFDELNEYYDCLEKCYRNLDIGREDLLDLSTIFMGEMRLYFIFSKVLRRFKEEMNHKFPHLADIPGFLVQKFNLPVKMINYNSTFPLVVRIPLEEK